MSIIFSSLLWLITLTLLIKSLSLCSGALIDAKARWQESYQHILCARLAVLEKNIDQALNYLAAIDTRPSAHLQRQEDASLLIQSWKAFYGELLPSSCPDVFDVYVQYSPSLPPTYPNWWLHWNYPSEEESDAKL